MRINKTTVKIVASFLIFAMIVMPFSISIQSILSPTSAYRGNFTLTNPMHRTLNWKTTEGTQINVKPVALVYSKLQLSHMLINETAWTLFSLEDLVMTAGIPYHVYPINDFISMNFSRFSAVILFNTLYLNNSLFDSFYVKLQTYLRNGGNIISIDFPPLMNETDAYNTTYLNLIFNAEYST